MVSDGNSAGAQISFAEEVTLAAQAHDKTYGEPFDEAHSF
jgi:hypothetical protein